MVRISGWPKTDAAWYLGVYCGKCNAPILFALDRSENDQPFVPVAKLVLTCSQTDCRQQADYSAATFSRFQK
jgi:hypothetical protein